MDNSRLPKQALLYKPRRTDVGRPRKRWTADVGTGDSPIPWSDDDGIKTVPSIGILWGGQTAFTMEGQVPVKSGTGRFGSLKEATFVPYPKLLGCNRHFQWQPESHRPRENQRQLDSVADKVILRKYCLCFTGSVRSLWNKCTKSTLVTPQYKYVAHPDSLFLSFFTSCCHNKHFHIRTVRHPGTQPTASCSCPCPDRYLT
jgi:hypothetical protein